MLRFSVLSWLVLAAYAVAGCTAAARANDDPKAHARARAALALAAVDVPSLVASDAPKIQARIAAKAALTKACGPSCPCEVCDCETCECCRADKVKPMPPASPPPQGGKVEKLTFAELRKAVEKLKPGEAVTVYAGQDAPSSVAGRVVVLTDAIPNEEQRIGVWRCWNESGEPKMATMQPPKGGKRISVEEQRTVGGRLVTVTLYLDEYPDGSRYWCVPCNKGK